MIDEFFYKQPEVKFGVEISNYVPRKVLCKKKNRDAVGFLSVFLDRADFKDDTMLLSSFEDFELFLKTNRLFGNKYRIKLLKNLSFEKEEFEIVPSFSECVIFAGEREGIRRALDKLEDLVINNGCNLFCKPLHCKSIIKRRFSRCFFAPINRPPHFRDELTEDEDFYPEGFLRVLMHNGINTIWIPTSFDDMVKTSYIKEFGQNSETRINKLNKVIDKCAGYGIEVFLFVIEPISLNSASIEKKHPGILQQYPQVHGNVFHDKCTGEMGVAFCTYTDFGKNYCIEAVGNIFKNSPKLAGLMCVTQGERITSCANVYMDEEFGWKNTCPHCSQYSKVDVLVHTVDVLKEGMRSVKPEAELISWTYEHRWWHDDEIIEYVDKISQDVVMMQNFEDNGRGRQLGKKRILMDYWLSFPKFSNMFKITAKEALKLKKKIYAKMQIGCSHEIASVPYIPVPGIVYSKIVNAKKLGVSGVMEGWFFGNYPSLMSKSVELLSSDILFKSKKHFLTFLASLYYSKEKIKYVVYAWDCFEKAYKCCPWNIMFSYYGPMHDSVVWKLRLLPKNINLGRSWQLVDASDGDRIGECLFAGHTIEEAISLLRKMTLYWNKGCFSLENLDEWKDINNERISVIKALKLLFASALNVLSFYKLRNDLGYLRNNPLTILNELKSIVNSEIENSKQMILLCNNDNRLGYHSEAEGYKFFPLKLQDRIDWLNNLLKTEFDYVESRIKTNKKPLEYFDGVDNISKSYYIDDNRWEFLSDKTSSFRIFQDKRNLYFELKGVEGTDFVICNEFELFFPSTAVIIKSNGRIIVHRDAITHQSVNDERIKNELKKWKVIKKYRDSHILLKVNKRLIGFKRFPFKTMVKTTKKASWCIDDNPVYTLGKSILSPNEFGWVKIKK